MQIRTITLTVAVPSSRVFHHLADLENLPAWTAGYCEWIELHSEGWWAYTPAGELSVDSKVDDIAGQIDLSFKHPAGWKFVIPLRIRTDGEGGAIVRLACAQSAGMSDEQYERLVEALLAGLRDLPARLPRELAVT
jgi:hypothetical protein